MSETVTALRDLVRTFPSALLGYSGGVDSAYLAVVLRQELGPHRMVAVIGRSASYPQAQWAAARAVAERFDVPLIEIATRELEDPNYLANSPNRCFFCKTELWSRLLPEARARGLAVVCDGTNADDLRTGEHRPGYAAGERAGIRSPLAEVGMTKTEIRMASRNLGLPTWDAPARLRLFVALTLPSPVRQALWQTVAPLRERGLPVKWVRPDGIHLTLKFLGDVAEERAADVRAALGRAAAGARPLPLALGEFGVFPDFQRPRVVWAGITADSRLEILQHRVEQEFAPLGFPTEARPFRPHVTLGRAAREARPRDFAGLEAALGALQFEATVVVESVDLMQSTLESAGAVYHVRHSERLS